jgi:hypothetical protein
MRFIDLSDRRKDGLPGFAGDSAMKITSPSTNHCDVSHLSTGGHRIGNETRWRLMPGAAADSAAPCIRLLCRDTPAPSRSHCDVHRIPPQILARIVIAGPLANPICYPEICFPSGFPLASRETTGRPFGSWAGIVSMRKTSTVRDFTANLGPMVWGAIYKSS